MSRYAEPMARLIEELKKLPGVGSKTAQRFAFHILRASDEDAARWLKPCAASRPAFVSVPSATTLPMSTPAPTAPVPRATSGWSAWSRSLPASPPSSARAAIRASTTFCTARFRRCTVWGPTSCAPARWSRRVERGEVDEVILATSPTIEGEATADWLAAALRRPR